MTVNTLRELARRRAHVGEVLLSVRCAVGARWRSQRVGWRCDRRARIADPREPVDGAAPQLETLLRIARDAGWWLGADHQVSLPALIAGPIEEAP
jgi:hypothetical protein